MDGHLCAAVSRLATHVEHRVLRYRTRIQRRMVRATLHTSKQGSFTLAFAYRLDALCLLFLFLCSFAFAAQQTRPHPAKGEVAELSAEGPQRHEGNLFIADRNVDIRYAGQRLREIGRASCWERV